MFNKMMEKDYTQMLALMLHSWYSLNKTCRPKIANCFYVSLNILMTDI
jgi:hypothetical protein